MGFLKNGVSQAELNAVVLGQVPNNTITDLKLSDDPNGIKQRFNEYKADNVKHITSAERTTWSAKAPTTQVSTSADGLMIAADKNKLNGIAAGATAYTHPANHPPSIIIQDASNRFVADTEKVAWNSVATRYSETAQSITTGVSVDTLVNNGLYQGNGLVNAPDVDWYLIEVIRHDSAWVYQRAIAFTQSEPGSSRPPGYERVMRGAIWGSWTRISNSPKIQTGTTSITIATAGTEVTKPITFPTAYSSPPIVILSLNTPSALSSGYLILHLGTGSVSTTGFMACANSYAAQAITGNWVAMGN